MAEWKKIIVSGSNISQLNNDSGYLINTGTIASASVAARATTLSPEATASIADTATSASHTFGTASIANFATTASHALNVPDTASHALTAVSSSFATQAGTSRAADSASVAGRATLLSNLATASFADLASSARTADSASVAARATTLSAVATASFADLASDARTATSASIAALASTLSATATASYADLAGTVHDGNITNAKIAAGTIANDRLVNDSVTIGASEVELGATIGSLTGLTAISATTGTFVLQVYESSSTIITSGSNIFGNDQADIQQITGSLKQSGSFTLSGSLKQSNGTISGSFEGDGSNLTGIATSLTVDGDSGTQNVSLTDDDLQIIGTANELETAVTKVGTDVKVTLGLPDTVAVTASVATRANSLAPTATASQADNATSASQAENATSASATTAGLLFPAADGIANQALVTNGAGQMAYGDIFGTGSTKKLNQSVAASTWSFNHSLNELYPIVQAYDSSGDQLIPARVESIDANNVKLYFTSNTAGVAAAMVGGMGISASNATRATSASIADLASTLSSTATASIADTATSASHTFGTASFADLASTARSASFASSGDGLFSGSFSGSFQGDGSDLTGIATSLTVDGDTGTQDVSLTADDLQIIGTAQEIETAVTKVGTDVKVTVGLPQDVTIGRDLTVTNNATIAGNLVVDGSIVSASSLAVEDQFIILASGSNGAIDGGIIVNQIDDDPDGKGKAFAYDSSANRWAFESNLNDTASVITPDAFVGVIQENAGAPSSAPTYGGTAGKGTILVDTSNDEAYIYV